MCFAIMDVGFFQKGNQCTITARQSIASRAKDLPYGVVWLRLGIWHSCGGRTREAAIFALSWGALLRIGEVFQAIRKDLILLGDVGDTVAYILLKIKEPKTRFRAARHQSGKLEQPDLIEVVQLGLSHLKPHERLWNSSGATLRSRLTKILEKLKLPVKNGQVPKTLTLASLRPGGATWLISHTESAELVKRRGRWISYKTMECYLQEVSATMYLSEIDAESEALILSAVKVFPQVLRRVISFRNSKMPETCWFAILARDPTSNF